MKIVEAIKSDNERGARRKLIEELFYDFHRARRQVYMMNFYRGVFFGFGTIIGGTVVVAIIIWILGQFAGWFPSIGEYTNQIINAIRNK